MESICYKGGQPIETHTNSEWYRDVYNISNYNIYGMWLFD